MIKDTIIAILVGIAMVLLYALMAIGALSLILGPFLLVYVWIDNLRSVHATWDGWVLRCCIWFFIVYIIARRFSD